MRKALLIAAGGLLLLCSSVSAEDSYPFPKDFVWGTATAAYQAEGGNYFCDWYQWEQMGKIKGNQRVGAGPNHFKMYPVDFSLAKKIGTNAYRFSIEWSRLEPRKDVWDLEAVAEYRKLITSMIQNGQKPYLTLYHWTLPTWLVDFKNPKQSHLQSKETLKQFAEFVEFVASKFGDLVDNYWTVNEPTIVSMNGYLAGNFPPGVRLSNKEVVQTVYTILRNHDIQPMLAKSEAGLMFIRALYHLVLFHTKAYDLVKKFDVTDADGDGKPAEVGVVVQYLPAELSNRTKYPVFANLLERFNTDYMNALKTGKIDLLGNHGLTKEEIALDPASLTGRVDMLGINYYSTITVAEMIAMVIEQFSGFRLPIPREKDASDLMGLKQRPEGLYRLAKDTYAKYQWPMMVSENGIATQSEDVRSKYLIEHLKRVSRLIQEGVPMKGYFHWSLIDNFEWHLGTVPRFGLIDVDYKTFARRIKTTGYLYKAIIEEQGIPATLLPSSDPTYP